MKTHLTVVALVLSLLVAPTTALAEVPISIGDQGELGGDGHRDTNNPTPSPPPTPDGQGVSNADGPPVTDELLPFCELLPRGDPRTASGQCAQGPTIRPIPRPGAQPLVLVATDACPVRVRGTITYDGGPPGIGSENKTPPSLAAGIPTGFQQSQDRAACAAARRYTTDVPLDRLGRWSAQLTMDIQVCRWVTGGGGPPRYDRCSAGPTRSRTWSWGVWCGGIDRPATTNRRFTADDCVGAGGGSWQCQLDPPTWDGSPLTGPVVVVADGARHPLLLPRPSVTGSASLTRWAGTTLTVDAASTPRAATVNVNDRQRQLFVSSLPLDQLVPAPDNATNQRYDLGWFRASRPGQPWRARASAALDLQLAATLPTITSLDPVSGQVTFGSIATTVATTGNCAYPTSGPSGTVDVNVVRVRGGT